MTIDVVLPRTIRLHEIKKQIKRYDSIAKTSDKIIDYQHRYIICIQKKVIRIMIFQIDEIVKYEINNYLQQILKDCSYIGIRNGNGIIQLKSTRMYEL